MSFALKGFVAGFAKGAKERVEKEREENEAIIQNRLKLAATNRTLRQKELDAQKQLLSGRLETVSSYLPEDATEEQKLALISNEEIAKQFVDMRSKGEEVDLNRFLILNKDKVPQNFSTVQQYIDTISAAPAPVSQEQIDTIRQTRGVFGARTGANVEKLAQQYGLSAAELLAYEQRGEVPQVPQFARIDVELLKKPKSIKERVEDSATAAFNAMEQFGDGSAEAKDAIAKHAELKARADLLNPQQERYARMLDEARVNVVLAQREGNPQKISQAKAELKRIEDVTRSEVEKFSPSDIRRSFRDVSMNAVSMLYPRLKDNLVAVRDPNNQQIIDYQVATTNPQIAAQVQNTRLAAMSRIYYNFYANKDGTPANRTVAETLMASGVEFDDMGRPIFEVAVPAAPAPASNAQRVTPRRRGGVDNVPQQQPQQPTVRNFRSVEEAEAAGLPRGTRITINGRPAEVQ
jgi:hypothetical protein